MGIMDTCQNCRYCNLKTDDGFIFCGFLKCKIRCPDQKCDYKMKPLKGHKIIQHEKTFDNVIDLIKRNRRAFFVEIDELDPCHFTSLPAKQLTLENVRIMVDDPNNLLVEVVMEEELMSYYD